MNAITLEYIGRDSWSRPVYHHDGRLYVDTDPRSYMPPALCSKYGNTFDGEPDNPISPHIQVIFSPHRDTWDRK